MEEGASRQKQRTIKPPWDLIEFQSSIYPDEKFAEEICSISYALKWNEMTHDKINEMKCKIEPLEKNHLWETLKKKTNTYELIYTQDCQECPKSIALIKPLSRSYFKMIEILQVSHFFERLPKGTQRLRSAHVAEGPGGFIEAFLEKCAKANIQTPKICAMTLKPTNSHIPGWRRTYNFLQKHPEIKIHYGVDGTGNLYNKDNQDSFVNLVDNQKVMLFTGDGGFDFSVDYENQEKSAYSLLLASAIIGIQVLAPGGMLVLKLFDIYSQATQYLLRIITICFKEWTLYKPATSRPCNSERYLICRDFRKCFPFILKKLKEIQETINTENKYPAADFFQFFSEKEKEYLVRNIEEFQERQLVVLEKTIQLNEENNNEFNWKPHYTNAVQWCSTFHIPTINLKGVY